MKPLLRRPEEWNSDVHIIHGKITWTSLYVIPVCLWKLRQGTP